MLGPSQPCQPHVSFQPVAHVAHVAVPRPVAQLPAAPQLVPQPVAVNRLVSTPSALEPRRLVARVGAPLVPPVAPPQPIASPAPRSLRFADEAPAQAPHREVGEVVKVDPSGFERLGDVGCEAVFRAIDFYLSQIDYFF